jgi:hypothetical protein
MKRWIALVLLATLALCQLPAQAQARLYSQAELDALLAPVALYPDPVLSNILVASTYPEDLRQAAAWSRANAQLAGEQAVRAADPMPWHPSVKALVAFPDLLARMDESPQWTADLGSAFVEQEPYVMDTVQELRRRAQANGALQSNGEYSVQQQGPSIAVYPAQPQVVYVPYYDPYVVYGPWWWPAYRPVFWRPWHPRPAMFVSTSFVVRSVDWRRRAVLRQAVHRTLPAPAVQTHTNHVRPIVDSVRIRPPQPPQPQRTEGRREFHRDLRAQAAAPRAQAPAPRAQPSAPRAQPSAPVSIHNQVRPIVDSVRNHPSQAQQRYPHQVPQQRMQSRGDNRHSQRRG